MIRLSAILLLSAAFSWSAATSTAMAQDPAQSPLADTVISVPIEARLQDLRPEEIARDVTSAFNPRTGRQELIAPTFDPFAEDETMAADVTLRTTSNARDLNGILMQDGALLDISLFYSRSGEPSFGRTRDALFLSGEPVPIVSRDSRDLECSSRVTETVYLADRYYGGFAGYRGLTHHSFGHRGFGHSRFSRRGPRYFSGFYDDHWGPAFRPGHRRGGFYGHGGGYSFGHVAPRPRPRVRPNPRRRPGIAGPGPDRPRPSAPSPQPRIYDVERYDSSNDSGQGRPRRTGRDYRRGPSPEKRVPITSPQPEGVERRVRPTVERPDRPRSDRPRIDRPRTDRPRTDRPRTDRPRVDRPQTDQPRTDRRPETRRPDRARTDRVRPGQSGQERTRLERARPKRPSRATTPTRRSDRPAPTRTTPTRTAPPRATPPPTTRSRPAPQPRSAPPPRRSAPSPSSSKPKARTTTTRTERRSTRRDTRRLELFPHDYSGNDVVVVSASRDCAVEDQLTLFIPNERLDAARFDGLTLWIRDIEDGGNGQTIVYDERPLFIPPNYIEGFRRAAR